MCGLIRGMDQSYWSLVARRLWLLTKFSRCPHCSGKGKRIAKMCSQCHGEKVVQTEHTLAVHIPGGAPEGFEEVFAGEADENVEWEAGDVVVRVRSQRREGEGDWARHESGILGRVTLSAAEVSGTTHTSVHWARPPVHRFAPRRGRWRPRQWRKQVGSGQTG